MARRRWSASPISRPGAEFWLGTDQIGRDMFSRLIYGARNTIGIALATTLLSFIIGGTLGVLTALKRGWLDQTISRIVDAFLAIPVLIFALMLLAVFGKSILQPDPHPGLARLHPRLPPRPRHGVERGGDGLCRGRAGCAARALGWIIFKEILPNILPPMITEFGLRFCFVFLTISALSFLGVGIQPPTADWGSMVAESKTLITFGRCPRR